MVVRLGLLLSQSAAGKAFALHAIAKGGEEPVSEFAARVAMALR
jgi:hypothetical protein